MRWSERLWRLRECWRKLGTLAGKGVGKRLDYACDLIMEAWVDDEAGWEYREHVSRMG